MCEKRCKTCGFWKDDELEHMGRLYPICKSQAFVDDFYFIGTTIAPKPIFGCRHWQQREPDLREQLTEHIQTSLMQCIENPSQTSEWLKNISLRAADDIIAIFEGWQQKGEGSG